MRAPCRIFESNVLLWFDSVLAQKKENRDLARLDPSITDQLRHVTFYSNQPLYDLELDNTQTRPKRADH